MVENENQKGEFLDAVRGYMQDIENNDFLHDFRVFLKYVAENKIKLTPKWRLIPRKDIYAINSLFRHPHPTEQKIGNITFKVRQEFELRYLHFIDLLSLASGCSKMTHRDFLRKGQNFTRFFDINGLTEISQLFLAWYFGMSWQEWFMRGGDFAERLQSKVKEIAQHLDSVKNSEKIDFVEFANNLITRTDVKWICIAGDKELSNARFGIRELLITPMQYFGAVELFTEKDEKGVDKFVSFKFTYPLGKYLINLLTFKKYNPKNN